jgi:NAD(P)H-flavin reductase
MCMPSEPGAAAPPEGVARHPLAPVPYRVRRRSSETPDTASLTLVPRHGEQVADALPGQFNMLYAFGIGEVAISVSGRAQEPSSIVHTVRSAGRISAALAGLPEGETVGVRGPYGTGWPLAEAAGRDVVVVAGGLGLAPLRPALYEMFEHRERYGRVEVIYGAKSPKDLVYYNEIQSWRARSDLRFQTTVDAAERSWYGDVGLVTQRLPDARFDPARTVAMLCGPEIMMRLTAEALEARGVPQSAIWVSLERNMKCAIGLCGHCQLGPEFICRDGPVFRYSKIRPYLRIREL